LYYPIETPAIVKKDKKGKIISTTPASKGVAKELDKQFIDEKELDASNISDYRIKGFWYFDKRQGEMKYRLLGICPMSPEAKDKTMKIQILLSCFGFIFLQQEKYYTNRMPSMIEIHQCRYLLIIC